MAYDVLISYPSLMGYSPSGTSAVSGKTIVMTLNAGANTVTHGIGYNITDVTIKDAAGIYAGAVTWENVDVDNITITVPAPIIDAIIDLEFRTA